MGNKVAEKEWASICSTYHIWCHKWSDSFWCPNCQKVVFPNRYNQDDNEKLETIVDYLVFVNSQPIWIECKGKHNSTSWPFSDITSKQLDFLSSWRERNVLAAVFLSFGPGKIPDRGAWLIPYEDFRSMMDDRLKTDKKSFSWTYMQDFMYYRMIWDKGGWSIPEDCWFTWIFPNVLRLPKLF